MRQFHSIWLQEAPRGQSVNGFRKAVRSVKQTQGKSGFVSFASIVGLRIVFFCVISFSMKKTENAESTKIEKTGQTYGKSLIDNLTSCKISAEWYNRRKNIKLLKIKKRFTCTFPQSSSPLTLLFKKTFKIRCWNFKTVHVLAVFRLTQVQSM